MWQAQLSKPAEPCTAVNWIHQVQLVRAIQRSVNPISYRGVLPLTTEIRDPTQVADCPSKCGVARGLRHQWLPGGGLPNDLLVPGLIVRDLHPEPKNGP